MPPITEKKALPKSSTASVKSPAVRAQVKPAASAPAQPTQAKVTAALSQDKVILGGRPINPGAAADKQLAEFARANAKSSAPSVPVNGGQNATIVMKGPESSGLPLAKSPATTSEAPTIKLSEVKAPTAASEAPTVKLTDVKAPATSSEAPTVKLSTTKAQAETVELTPDSPKTSKGAARWKNADGVAKVFSGFSNMRQGVEDIYAGKTGTGALELSTGAMDWAGAASHFGEKIFKSSGALGKMTTLGTISDFGSFGLSAIGTAVSAYETVDGLRTGNEVKAVEKGMDTLAGAASTIGGLPGMGTAVTNLAGATTSASGAFAAAPATAFAGLAAAAGLGYGVGRLVSSSTGLDGKVEEGFSNNYFHENRDYAHQNDLDLSAGNFAQNLNDGDLQRLAQKHSDIFAQSITGTLTEIENAKKSGNKEALSEAQEDLMRMRDAQHGRLV